MGSVIPRAGKKRTKLIYAGIFAAYAIFAFAFITIGLQPIRSAEVAYADESAVADATITIDAIGLDAPVMQSAINENTLSVPEQIAASYSTTQTKTLIFGHSSTVFKDLHQVSMGDEIVYRNQTYHVINTKEQRKDEISMSEILAPTKTPTIILMTCSGDLIPGSNGDHTHRLIITAEL